MRSRSFFAIVAAAALAFVAGVTAEAGDGSIAHAIRSAFGGAVVVRSPADDDVLTWDAATRSWGPAAATNALHVVRVRRTSTQAISDNTATDVIWQVEDEDTAGVCNLASAATKVFTASAAGEVWDVDATTIWSASMAPGTTTIRVLLLASDTTTVRWSGYTAVSGFGATTSAKVTTAAAGDFCVLRVYQNSGVSVNLDPSSTPGWVAATATRSR